MNDLNGWLIVVAFLAGVIFTLLWSLRSVTRKVSGVELGTSVDASVVPEEMPIEAVAAAAASAPDDAEPAPSPEGGVAAGSSPDDGEDISWWDRAFVANRPAPAISPTEQESSSERSYGGTANRDLLGPAGERIKGNRESMLYHTIASPYYGRTTAEEWFATEAAAEAAGFTRWDRRKLAATKKPTDAPVTDEPVAAPKPRNGKTTRNGKATRGTIKGNRGSMLYHTVDSPYYGRTKAEEWFTTEADAAAAGYRRWDHKRAQRA